MTSNINTETQVIDFIKNLPNINSAQLEWKTSNFEYKKQIFQNIILTYKKYSHDIIQSESIDQKLPLDFVQKASYEVGLNYLNTVLNDFANTYENEIGQTRVPVGLVTVILSWNLFNRLFIESVIPALFSGNAVIVKASSLTIQSLFIWRKILLEAGVPENVITFIVTKDKNFKSLIVSHPSVKAVKFYGHLEHGLDVLKNSQVNIKNNFKKISMNLGSKNAALYFKDFDEVTAKEVLNSFYIGQGQLAWNSTKLYISEKQEKTWLDFINEYKMVLPAENSTQDVRTLVKNDQGQFFVENTWVKNLSRCSTLQHDELSQSLFILESVKYPFDVPKRINAGYYGFACSVWGDKEKLTKVVSDIDVGLVSFNEWSVYKDVVFNGVKQSAYGIKDSRIFGELYCDVRKMT